MVEARAAPIPFERGMKPRTTWGARDGNHTLGNGGIELAAAAAANGSGPAHFAVRDEHSTAMATVVQAREIVNHLDPLGVGARDLRECLLIQIAAQRREAEMALKRGHARKASYAEELDELLQAATSTVTPASGRPTPSVRSEVLRNMTILPM